MAKRGWLVAVAGVVGLACGGGAPPGEPQPQPPGGPDQVAPTCVPTTCAAAGASCGTVPDGCDDTLACGTCGAGQTCGGSGKPNVCGAGAPAAGALQWLAVTRAPVVSVTSDRAGSIAVLRGNASAKTISRYDAAGNVVWNRPVGADAAEITLEASGSIFILGGYEHASSGARIDRLSADGSTLTTVAAQGTDMDIYQRVSVNPRGDWVHTHNSGAGASSIALHRADGVNVFLVESDDFSVFFQAVALDEAGNVFSAAYAREPFTHGGRTYPQGLVLLKLNRNLEITWIQPLPRYGQVHAMATTHLGTVVVLGRFSSGFAWGGATFSGGDAVFVAEADGAPRFFRSLPEGASDNSWRLAVDPAGKMTLGTTLPGCSGAMVREINLAGDELWTRRLTSDACAVTVEDVGTVAGGALVVGSFDGSVDFGKGATSGGGGYLVNYRD